MRKMIKRVREMAPKDYRTTTKIGVVLLRLTMGWMMFYAGITKVLNPEWTAAGFLERAVTLRDFFLWFASPEVLPVTNFLNAWGLTVIGACLILGLFVRASAIAAILMMLLYYLPLPLLYPDAHSFIVDDHVIYIAGFVLLAGISAGRFLGLDAWVRKQRVVSKNSFRRGFIG